MTFKSWGFTMVQAIGGAYGRAAKEGSRPSGSGAVLRRVRPSLPATEGSAQAALQEAINEKAKRRWQLISVMQNPTNQGLFLVWDTSGVSSG